MIALNPEKVQLQRAKTGRTTEYLAKRYGCSVSQFNALLRKNCVRETTAGRLARALGCDVEDIVQINVW